jgi:phenylacetate-coenzyme A ligase PaaK-like adenylate-forming protein
MLLQGWHALCLYVEIVDPGTGRQLGPGEAGEGVASVFDEVYPIRIQEDR